MHSQAESSEVDDVLEPEAGAADAVADAPGGLRVMVIDDIRWSRNMYRGWKALQAQKSVGMSMEFMNQGLLFFSHSIQKQHYIL